MLKIPSFSLYMQSTVYMYNPCGVCSIALQCDDDVHDVVKLSSHTVSQE